MDEAIDPQGDLADASSSLAPSRSSSQENDVWAGKYLIDHTINQDTSAALEEQDQSEEIFWRNEDEIAHQATRPDQDKDREIELPVTTKDMEGTVRRIDGNDSAVKDADNVEEETQNYTRRWVSSRYDGASSEDEDAVGRGDSGEESDDEESDLPLFANEANKQLHKEVTARRNELAKLKANLKENASRLAIMVEHLKSVQQELAHSDRLLAAKSKEKESESHLKQLADRELGRLRIEFKKLKEEEGELLDRAEMLQENIINGESVMEHFKQQMDWNQEELEQWATAAKQKEEDNLALEKFKRADETRIKDLNLQIEKYTTAVNEKKLELQDQITETQAKDLELDKTAEEFRRLHKERQDLVTQWQDTLETMKKRDREIAMAASSFSNTKAEVDERKQLLAGHKRRLTRQEEENQNVTSQIKKKEATIAKAKEDLTSIAQKLTDFKDEVEVVKNSLNSAAGDLIRVRSQTTTLQRALEQKQDKLEKVRKLYQETKNLLERESSVKNVAQKSAVEAEAELNAREQQLKRIEQELQQKKAEVLKREKELFGFRQKEKELASEIRGARATSRNLTHRLSSLTEQVEKQQELLYTGDFQIQQMERKVSRAMGHRTVDETIELKAKIKEIQEVLDTLNAQRNLLNAQMRKVNDELRAQQKKSNDCALDRERISQKINDLELELVTASQSLKSNNKDKEELIVQHDIKKLEVRRLRDHLNTKADEVYSLENKKQQLKFSIEEKKKDIDAHRDVQRANLKCAEEARHKVVMELKDRQFKMDRLKVKYEALVKSSKFTEDGEERSQAYFVIKAAQRREELQREGDELDEEIRKREKEMRALEKTLQHLNTRNTSLRQSLQKPKIGSSEAKTCQDLEEQIRMSQAELFRTRKDLSKAEREYASDMQQLNELNARMEEVREHRDQLLVAKQQVDKERSAQAAMIERAKERAERLKKEFIRKYQANAQPTSNQYEECHEGGQSQERQGAAQHPLHRKSKYGKEILEEQLLRAKYVKDLANTLLHALGQLSKDHPEITDGLKMRLDALDNVREELTLKVNLRVLQSSYAIEFLQSLDGYGLELPTQAMMSRASLLTTKSVSNAARSDMSKSDWSMLSPRSRGSRASTAWSSASGSVASSVSSVSSRRGMTVKEVKIEL